MSVKDTTPYFLNFDTEGLCWLIYTTMYQNRWWTESYWECEEQGGDGLPFSSFSPLWFPLFKEPFWGRCCMTSSTNIYIKLFT